MKKEDIISFTWQHILLLISLYVMTFGVAACVRSQLGSSVISTIPYVLASAGSFLDYIPKWTIGGYTIYKKTDVSFLMWSCLSTHRNSGINQIISDIKADESIPKYASNLVYVNHAGKEGAVDDKLLYSIINKQPKRADHYWLINMDFVDTPDTLEYRCETLVPDTLYSITMHIGFRIEPRVSLYLRQVVEDLVDDKKVDLTSTYSSLRKNGISGDFRFIIIHRVYYPESSDNRQQNLLMSIYALICKIGIDEPKALGLDTSMVTVERVPLIINQRNKSIRRIKPIVEEKEEHSN